MLEKLNCYAKRLSILLITVALIVVMGGCLFFPSSQNLEIQDWYDLDAVRDNLSGQHTLMNDLDSTTAGYEELASPTANGGKGWQPIGTGDTSFKGTFDGQGYEIRDLFINRPDEDFVGGLLGGNVGTVSNSYSSGNVNGGEFVGGLVGFNGETSTVSNSYSTSNVNGSYGVGGLVGGNVNAVSNSYSTGSVTGDNGTGGLLGLNGEAGTVSNSYSTGNVTGSEYVGGLVGGNVGTMSASFWDTETSGQATSAGGTGKTSMEMKDIGTFSGVVWDIIAVNPGGTDPTYTWNIVDDETYPFLSWQ
jgi:hypothetical protein